MTSNDKDVAIIGVGLHPFGRFEGKSAMQMGVDAILAAVADAGIAWRDVQFATGGSWTVANPDAIVGMVGLTGIPFTNVFNACATAASAAKACADGIRLGDYDIGIAVGLDKHPRGAFTEDPALVGMPRWYAENGQYLTTQFFGMKANRYLLESGAGGVDRWGHVFFDGRAGGVDLIGPVAAGADLRLIAGRWA